MDILTVGTKPLRFPWGMSQVLVLMSCLSSYCVNKNLSYALQLFDEDNPLHKSDNKYIFTTEGHVVPIDKRFREKQWNDDFPCEEGALTEREPVNQPAPRNISNVRPCSCQI